MSRRRKLQTCPDGRRTPLGIQSERISSRGFTKEGFQNTKLEMLSRIRILCVQISSSTKCCPYSGFTSRTIIVSPSIRDGASKLRQRRRGLNKTVLYAPSVVCVSKRRRKRLVSHVRPCQSRPRLTSRSANPVSEFNASAKMTRTNRSIHWTIRTSTDQI